MVVRSSDGPLGFGMSISTISSIPSHEICSRLGGKSSMSFSNRITPSANLFGAHVFALGPSNHETIFFMAGNSSNVMNERSHQPGDLTIVT